MAGRTRKSALVALLAAGSIALGAMPSMSAPAVIKANDFAPSWDPGTRRVPKGKRVVWKNTGHLEKHNVRAYGGNWTFRKPLPAGGSVSRRFRKIGTFKFFCTRHGDTKRVDGKLQCNGMCGRVRVLRP